MLSPQCNTNLLDSSYLETPASQYMCPSPQGFFNAVQRTPAPYFSPQPVKTPVPYSYLVTNMIYDIQNEINMLKTVEEPRKQQPQVYVQHEQLDSIVESIVDSEYSAMENRILARIQRENRLSAIESNLAGLKISFDSISDYK